MVMTPRQKKKRLQKSRKFEKLRSDPNKPGRMIIDTSIPKANMPEMPKPLKIIPTMSFDALVPVASKVDPISQEENTIEQIPYGEQDVSTERKEQRKVQWVSQEMMPVFEVLKEIRDILTQIRDR